MGVTIHSISEVIAEKLLGNTEDTFKKVKLCYCVEYILDSVIKTLVLYLLFACLGFAKEFVLCWLAINITRRYIGGLHMKTGVGCLILSFFIYFTAIIMGEIVSLSTVQKIIVLIVDVIIAFLYGPFPSEQRPRYSEKTKRKFRIKGIVGICIVVLADVTMDLPTECMMWILILQIMESVIAVFKINIRERRKMQYEEGSNG